jgi:hypothetical protein
MKNYIIIDHFESSGNEMILKVLPIYCAKDEENVFNVNHTDYTPNKGDKLFFLPGVNVPRIKLKDLGLKYGIKTVRDIDVATHVFIGKSTTNKLLNTEWYYIIPTESLVHLYEHSENYMDDYYRENLREILEHYTEDIVLLKYPTASAIRNSNLSFVQEIENTLQSSNVFYTIDEEYKTFFPGILNALLYDESTLLKHINGDDSATIDETIFDQLGDMFKSSDNDNHVLAMEIMANCNYAKSLLYLEFLFKEYGHVMANSHTKNHVNFKSLVSYLGKSGHYFSTDIDDVVNSLKVKGQLTIDSLNIIMKHYSKEISQNGGTDCFEVKTITLSEDLLAALNVNYIYEHASDFTPVQTEEEISETVVDLEDLSPETVEVASLQEDEEISDEDTEASFEEFKAVIDSLETNSAEEEALALEDASFFSESELNEPQGSPEEESNNNQIEETNGGDDFEWF